MRNGKAQHVKQFGSVVDDITAIITEIPQYTGIIANVLADPAFPQVIAIANRIATASAAQSVQYPPGYVPSIIPEGYPPGYRGIGLDKAIFPLETFAWYVENPVLGPLAILALIATPIFIGYYYGKSTGRAGKAG